MTATQQHIEVKEDREVVDFLVTPIDVEEEHEPVHVYHDVEHVSPSLSELLHGR